MNNSWQSIVHTQLYEQAGTIHRAFIRMLFNYDESIRRSKHRPDQKLTLNHLWMSTAFQLTHLPPEVYRQYFGSGRFPNLDNYCNEYKKSYQADLGKWADDNGDSSTGDIYSPPPPGDIDSNSDTGGIA